MTESFLDLLNSGFYSDYHEETFSAEQMEEAIELYVKWCAENNQTPEWDTEDYLIALKDDPGMVGHIVYHAEIMGFKS